MRYAARWFACLIVCIAGVPAGGVSAVDDVFSWRQCSGQRLRVMLDRHPYSDGIRRRLDDFEALTGIKVAYIMHPEARYFRCLRESFEDPSASPDVYMAGVYQVWEYVQAGRITPLDPFIVNPVLTRQGYNINDFFPRISGAFRWSGLAGARLGEGPLWAVPLGFEFSALTYNREVFSKHRLNVPSSLEDLLEAGKLLVEFEGGDTYGVAARGAGQWNSLHSGYITAFANYGAKDVEVEEGRLVSRVNSPEAVAVTDLWIRLLRECGPPDWEEYTWYRCLDDMGDRKAAVLYDSNVLGYYANSSGLYSQSGKLGMAPPPVPEGVDPSRIQSNVWTWGLAINPDSKVKEAAWLFIQYFTSVDFQTYSVLEWSSVNPPRQSVFNNPAFKRKVAAMHGYEETLQALIGNTTVHFTPTPFFNDISERWAAVIRDIANGMYGSTQEGMDALKIWMDDKLSGVKVE